jgi:dimeric dUTPase (all-alpha-NTP-PPase superfamily)
MVRWVLLISPTYIKKIKMEDVMFDKNKKEDMLEEMFDRCKYFQKRVFNYNLPKHLPERIPISITSIVAELGEILEENQKWKDWRRNHPEINETNLLLEVADLWHFIINLTLYLGYDADVIYKAFLKKNKINHERQNNKY